MTQGYPSQSSGPQGPESPVPAYGGPAEPSYGGTATGPSYGSAYESLYGLPQQRTTDVIDAALGAESAPEPSAVGTAEVPETPAPAAKKAGKPGGRDRYLDLLRSLALVRIVVYHLFGWAWLTVLFPSMGVMFALAGSLMARSLNRPALSVIRGRVRRLLPPLWAFSAVALAMMFAGGWNPTDNPDGSTWGIVELFNYIVPVGAPPFRGVSAPSPAC